MDITGAIHFLIAAVGVLLFLVLCLGFAVFGIHRNLSSLVPSIQRGSAALEAGARKLSGHVDSAESVLIRLEDHVKNGLWDVRGWVAKLFGHAEQAKVITPPPPAAGTGAQPPVLPSSTAAPSTVSGPDTQMQNQAKS